MQRIESRRTAFCPGCQQHVTSPVTAGNDAKPRRVLRRGFCRAPTFDLNQNDLQGISALRSGNPFAVIFSDGYQVNDAARFAPMLSR